MADNQQKNNDVTEFPPHATLRQSLLESKMLYEGLLGLSPLPIGISTLAEGRFLLVNDRFCQLTGYKKQEVLGRTILDVGLLVEPEDWEKLTNELYRNGEVRVFESHVRCKNGSIYQFQISARKIIYNGEPCLLSITTQYDFLLKPPAVQPEIATGGESYRSLLELAPDAITVGHFEDGRYLQVNRSFCKLSGYAAEEAIGRTANELNLYVDPEDRIRMLEQLQKYGQAEGMEIRFRSKFGEIVHTLTSARRIQFRGVDCLLVIVTNTSALKRAQEALNQSEEKFRNLLETMEEGYYEVDEFGTVTYFNQATLALHGYSADELMGMSYKQFVAPEDLVEMKTQFQRMYRTGVPAKVMEYRIVRMDGTIRNLEMSAYPRKNSEGKIIGFCGITRDRTTQKEMEAQLLQSKKMEAIGSLAGGIAHDFNNLLMGIKGNTTLAMMDLDEKAPLFSNLTSIEQYVKAGSDLTKQLLGAAKAGKYEVKPTDLNRLVKRSVELFGRTRKEFRIHNTFAENLKAVEVDRSQIEQVLLNILINAWHAMPQGGDLYIETRNLHLDDQYLKPYAIPPGAYVKLSITDTGVGIAPEHIKRIFDPFFTTKGMGKGTGLGLASAYGIISNHGGLITVYSEKDAGATFNVYLPASEKKVTTRAAMKTDVVKGTETILFVDDEPGIVEVGMLILERLGYTVISSPDGAKAVEIYKERKEEIDIVIVDMIMPGFSGGDTFDALKKINPDVKVILSSGYSLNGQAQNILDKGCNGFIQKPFSMQNLSAKLREVLDKDR